MDDREPLALLPFDDFGDLGLGKDRDADEFAAILLHDEHTVRILDLPLVLA